MGEAQRAERAAGRRALGQERGCCQVAQLEAALQAEPLQAAAEAGPACSTWSVLSEHARCCAHQLKAGKTGAVFGAGKGVWGDSKWQMVSSSAEGSLEPGTSGEVLTWALRSGQRHDEVQGQLATGVQ